jgi:hypothetical protein
MSVPMTPFPMLSGAGGNGKALMVIGVLAVLVMMAAKKSAAAATTNSK